MLPRFSAAWMYYAMKDMRIRPELIQPNIGLACFSHALHVGCSFVAATNIPGHRLMMPMMALVRAQGIERGERNATCPPTPTWLLVCSATALSTRTLRCPNFANDLQYRGGRGAVEERESGVRELRERGRQEGAKQIV